jgi:hypothetical protein
MTATQTQQKLYLLQEQKNMLLQLLQLHAGSQGPEQMLATITTIAQQNLRMMEWMMDTQLFIQGLNHDLHGVNLRLELAKLEIDEMQKEKKPPPPPPPPPPPTATECPDCYILL